METPDLSHLSSADYGRVYEPAEDSFLLLDALQSDLPLLRRRRPHLALELGSGSGLVVTALASALPDCLCLATDRSQDACRVTARTAAQNGVTVLPARCDLAAAFSGRLTGAVDLLVFNPPYVVTESSELEAARRDCDSGRSPLAASWAGGVDGRQVTDRLLPQLCSLLAPDALFYLVTVRENNVPQLGRRLAALGLHTEVAMSRRSGPEHLSVLRISNKTTD